MSPVKLLMSSTVGAKTIQSKIACVPFVKIPTSSQYLVTCTYTIYEWYRCALEMFKILLHVYKSKEEDKDQESIQSSTTPDPGYQWESNTSQTRAKRSALSQQVTTSHQKTDVHESKTKTCKTKIHKRSTAFEMLCSVVCPYF